MRRETDFVLEKAAWPTLLVEESGRICRANQAARRVFGFADRIPAIPLTTLWSDANAVTPAKFLELHTDGGSVPLTLLLHGGHAAPFAAHLAKVQRDEQNYFVLQLFKDATAAFPELAFVAPLEKEAQIPFALVEADWPALLVDELGGIVRANPAAARIFGVKATMEGAMLNALSSAEEASAITKILAQPTQNIARPFLFRPQAGDVAPFQVHACSMEGTKLILLQLFPSAKKVEAGISSPPAPKSDAEFLLQNAEWPALLIHKSGKIIATNRAAVRSFGASIAQEDAQLGAIWSPQNRGSCQQFLNLPPPPEPIPLQFHLKSGLPGAFLGQLCAVGQEEICLLQLLPSTAANPSVAPAEAPAAGKSSVETNLAHKQKLDCALQLARSVALDFNNALTSILGHASLLLSKAEANHPWRSSLNEIEKSAAKAAEIANDLAAFSRQEKDVRVQVSGNLNGLLERTVEVFQSSMTTPITISLQLERKLFTANFDEAKMQQALVKILENAVESIQGAGKISVLTRNVELTEPTQDRTAKLNPGNYVCVEISDNGAGISEEIMPRVFEPFFTTKGARHRGLGLAWVYGIITNHGGGVALSSQPGAGSTVRIYLPANKKIVREKPLADGDLHGTQTVLLVDDEDLLLTMGQMVLSSYGYTVMTANSGQKALEIFTNTKKKIDLVITDLVMPNMSGRELSEHILKATPGARILWCSGYVRPPESHEPERYLQKPFTSQDLLRKVKHMLAE